MGRYSYSSRSKVEDVKKISIPFLKKNDYFCGYNSGTITWTRSNWGNEHKSSVSISVTVSDTAPNLRIWYTQTDNQTGEKKDFDYKIPLTSSPCRYGGKRWYFTCPCYKNGVYCGKRIRTLYKDGDYFACRHCYNLTYQDRNKNRKYKYASLFRVFELDQKTYELYKKIKRRTYKGKLTHKQRKLEGLYKQIELNEANYDKIYKLLKK